MSTKLGLIGLVHEEARQDFWATMRRLADIGYQGVESPAFPEEGDLAEHLRDFQSLGLEVAAMGASREDLRERLDEVAAAALARQTRNVVVYWGPCESKEQLLRDAALYDEAGARLRERGLRLCYHNHEHEFRSTYNGLYALDILAEHSDPRNLAFEIDIAWATFGGEDPVRLLRRYAGRVPLVHVKDLYRMDERESFTAPGTGLVNIPAAAQAAVETGVEWLVIEQDHVRNLDAFQTVTLAYLYMKELGFA